MSDEIIETEMPPAELSGDDLFQQALLLYENKSYSKALNMLINKYEHDKTGVYADFIGNCYQKLGSVNDATQFWQKSISQNPTSYKPFLSLGNAAYSQNNIKQSLIYWHIALSLCPENSKLNYNLATAYSRKDDRLLSVFYYEKFLKYCRDTKSKDFVYVTKLISVLRKKAGEMLRYANAAVRQNKIDVAVQFYIKSIKNYPMQPKVIQNLAKIFTCDRNFDKAIEYNKMAMAVDDGLKICLIEIAKAYIAKKEYEMAYCYFTRFFAEYNTTASRFAEVERIAQYAKSKIRPDYDIGAIFTEAVSLENNMKYREALDMYENYRLLTKENEERVIESIKKLNLMIHPERILVKILMNKVEEHSANGKYEHAIALCDRIVILSSNTSNSYQWASKKRQEIKYIEFKNKEGKRL